MDGLEDSVVTFDQEGRWNCQFDKEEEQSFVYHNQWKEVVRGREGDVLGLVAEKSIEDEVFDVAQLMVY